jgi:hypothetical protein
MDTHFFGDTAVLLGRSLKHITRSLDTIITTAVMPVAFLLLFVYVFGGAVKHGSGSYVTYLLPGILLITIASGISYTAYRLFLDMKGGIFERFQSMPIARSSGAVVARADLAGRQSDLARGRRGRRPAHGLPLGGRGAGLARDRRHPDPVHPAVDVDRHHPRPVRARRAVCVTRCH